MALFNTNLIIQGSHLPATFKGTPDDLFVAMLERMKIVSASGVSFFVVGDIEPSSNLGPWLKNGTQWWVFDAELKRYVPLDISASETRWFQVGATTPTTADPPVWLRTTNNPTEAEPSIGTPIAWYLFDGTTWIDFTSLKDRSVTQEKLFYTANFFGTASGTNNYSVAFQPATAFNYGDGSTKAFVGFIKFTNANTGAVTLSVNGGGGAPVKKNVNQELVAGEIDAGAVHLLVFDGVNFQIQSPVTTPGPPLPIVPGGIIAFSDGLVIQNNPGSPTTTVDITAQRVILGTTNGASFLTFSVIESIDITVPGLGGLDTITTPEAASTWYYIWLVSDGSDVSAVFSTSDTAPVLPAGYIYTALLGAIYNDAASNLITIWQTDRRTSIATVSITTLVGLTPVDVAVPPIAKTSFGTAGIPALPPADQFLIVSGDGTVGAVSIHINNLQITDTGFFEVPLMTPQNIFVSAAGFTLIIAGFTI